MASSSSSNGTPQTWVPPNPTRDCSQGFCSAYCPQWCYVVFPPPPFDISDGGSSSSAFSPLVIAIIGILASALLLVSYYTIISKYCGTFDSLWRHLLGPGDGSREAGAQQSNPTEEWHGSPSSGLDKSLIDKMIVCKYKKGDGLVNYTDCSVCLSEFREEESFRLLPECSHPFHVQCIDTWLKSHTNCPLCRASIVAQLPPPPPSSSAPSSSSSSSRGQGNRQEVVVVVDEPELVSEEETHMRNGGDRAKRRMGEATNGRNEIRDEGVRPNDSADSNRRGVSIAAVLQTSMEQEMVAAKEHSRRRS
ncbi:E3 ubiquitin-protein ligase Os04g0590900-like [Typha latifolia]|uniref:E3 ubiquitin-protein ligase Os04g0590900-like n=1 Tax=Typha latifolia TaxID=4733 RepID=UPI003C2F5CA3